MQVTPSSTERTVSPVQAREDQGFEAGRARQYLNDIKGPLKDLTAAIDALQSQTLQIALLGDPGTKEEILDLRQQMRNQDQKHKEGIVEIQGILDDMLENKVVANMRKQVEQEIAEHIEGLVKEQVAECLKVHIPQELQDEIAMSKRELDELNLRLHNSESRRANGNLRHNKPEESLATMYMEDGKVSEDYPKDLKTLFELDDNAIKKIMNDYGLPEPLTGTRNHNLNRLMQFCGVRYQLVERRPSDSASSL